ncbi:MAG: DUF255 domain-containing protein [Clostridia bacterium]|nr:DUF255 domain-containing protein [Clostridia bacterium]
MRVSSYPHPIPPPPAPPGQKEALFEPLHADAFLKARARGVPVFLVIGDIPSLDDAVCAHLRERTVPVQLIPGARPDVELLCQRCSALFSGEGALPLCALLLSDGRPFLAAPLPPPGFPLDGARLLVWLTQADRRYAQNLPACAAQAGETIHSFRSAPLSKAYTPKDAAHDALFALLHTQDSVNGGFLGVKSPHVCALRLLQSAAGSDKKAHAALTRTLDAMLSSALYDPLDGGFFRSTLTQDWRVFVPEKPLALNALLALILLRAGRRTEAIRTLDFLISSFSCGAGALSPQLSAPRSAYAFTPEQVCAALGSENGLRACRLLGLLRMQTAPEPDVLPSRFSPVPPTGFARQRESRGEAHPRCPVLSPSLTPEDAAFLRRIMPALLRARAAREPQRPTVHILTEHCALAAAILAGCGLKLGEARYVLSAQRAVSFLLGQHPGAMQLPPSVIAAPGAQPACGASAALSLALLTLGQAEGMEEYAHAGLRLLGGALHAFVRPDGVVMHTQKDPGAFLPRVPALYDGELPAPAALLVRALRIADGMRPDLHYADAIDAIWEAASPAVRAQPLACAALIHAAACS